MDEIVNEIKHVYLDWYNSDSFTYKEAAKALYKIGTIIGKEK